MVIISILSYYVVFCNAQPPILLYDVSRLIFFYYYLEHD